MDPLVVGGLVALCTVLVLFSGVSVAVGLLIVSAGFLLVFEGLGSFELLPEIDELSISKLGGALEITVEIVGPGEFGQGAAVIRPVREDAGEDLTRPGHPHHRGELRDALVGVDHAQPRRRHSHRDVVRADPEVATEGEVHRFTEAVTVQHRDRRIGELLYAVEGELEGVAVAQPARRLRRQVRGDGLDLVKLARENK